MPPRIRRPDPGKVSAAFAAQHTALVHWLAGLSADQRERIPLSQFNPGAADLDQLTGLLVFANDLRAEIAAPAPPFDRDALAIVTRGLVDRLALAAPGRSVELRVPPFAAVQCVAGPRHTRGKPPSVVETDPLTWLELATGRIAWAKAVAVGKVSASGERSDLTAYLPLALG